MNDKPDTAEEQERREVDGYNRLNGEGQVHSAVAAREIVDDDCEKDTEQALANFAAIARLALRDGGNGGQGFAAIGALRPIGRYEPAAKWALSRSHEWADPR